MGDPAAMRDAVALLTLSVHGERDDLEELTHELLGSTPADELVLAVVGLARSLCFTTARLVHAHDGDLSLADSLALDDLAVREAALEVLQAFGRRAQREGTGADDARESGG